MNRNTIYIKLFAGLGNQLFQYAYGKYLMGLGERVRFILNRTYDEQVNCFDLPECFSIDESEILMPKTKMILILYKFFAKFVARTWHTDFYQEYRYPASLPGNTFIFKRQEEYKTTDISIDIMQHNSVAMHIRGGDYLTDNTPKIFGNICTPDYYKNAILYLQKKIHDPLFFIFTNDKIYAEKILTDMSHTHIYIPDTSFSQDPAYDLFLMSHCKHAIIANSTYSWWGAFLNKNSEKIIITPSKWTNDNQISISQLIPNTWIKI